MDKRRKNRHRDRSEDSDSSSSHLSHRHHRHHKSHRRPYHNHHDHHRRKDFKHSRSEKYRKRSRERSHELKKSLKREVKEKPINTDIEIGMRSWNEVCVKPIQEIQSENVEIEENFRINEVWVSNDLKDSEIFNKKKDTEKWQHDKFGDILRDYDHLERIKELQEIKAQQKKTKKMEGKKKWRKESPKWLHDMFETMVRSNDPEYRYVIRLSPPIHQAED